MEFTGIIYCIQNQVNKKRYIGQTVYAWYDRWRDHLRKACSGEGFALHKAMRKYGIEKFIVKVVEVVSASSIKELSDLLNEREIYWIAVGNTFHNGYNETLGGGGWRQIDDETMGKIYDMWNLGYPAEDIAFEYNCGRTTVNRILTVFGISEDETYARLRDASILQARQVAQIDFCTRRIHVRESMSEAARHIGHSESPISLCCSGGRNSAHGYYWKYLEEVSKNDLESGYYSGDLPESYGSGSNSPVTERQYDYDEVRRLNALGYTQTEIAGIIGCTPSNVSKILDYLGVSREGRKQQGMASRMRAVVALDEQGNVVGDYDSIVSAAKAVGRDPSSVRQAVIRGRKSAGYYWQYKDN